MALLLVFFAIVMAPNHAIAQAHASVAGCSTLGIDDDDDGIPTVCELQLAIRYAPILIARASGCDWDGAQKRLAGGYFFAVQQVEGRIRIAYMPAYFRDCGWQGAKCRLPGVDCAPHDGDSEFIVVELARDLSVSGVFLSAHCFGRTTSSCRWYRGEELRRFEWVNGAPVVWVSEGRNANYPSRAACDKGHHFLDTCDHNEARYQFPTRANANIGSAQKPLNGNGCVPGREIEERGAANDVVECFWRPDARFHGWQKGGTGVTGYHRYLSEIARF